MIRYVKGLLSMIYENGIVVETGSGLGLEISIPAGSPLYKYKEGDMVMVYTKMVVREDDMSLFGFHNKESLDFFNMLTTVSGIGPKGAMGILGAMPLDMLKSAIVMGDVKSISSAPGIGKKTAERLIVELKDKVGKMSEELGEMLSVSTNDDITDSRQEAVSALVALGYSKQEALAAVNRVKDNDLSSEEYIKNALKSLF